MPNTYSQMYAQIVFAVQGKQNIIHSKHREELHKYITGIIQNRGQKLLAIYCNADHLHLLVGFKPSIAISDLVRDIKAISSKFINDKKWNIGRFAWQEGFGSFTYSRNQIDNVIKYILDQPQHHKRNTFKEEYLEILKKNEVDYDVKYLFEWFE